MITVVDYGAGNCGSVIRMIEKVGGHARRGTSADDVVTAEKIILPGVGAFDHGMHQLASFGLIDALHVAVQQRRVPVLGICLGMQLMCNRSEEGQLRGLGWVDAEVRRFSFDESARLPIPHMAWNTLQLRRQSALLHNLPDRARFYFVHSYKVACADPGDIVATTDYGGEFVSIFSRRNVFGVQFHPEKSHRFGMAMIRNFLELRLA